MPVRVDRIHYERMQEVRARDGIPIAEQVRRALDAWLKERERPARATRKRR